MIIVSVDKLECLWDDSKESLNDVFWISFSLTKGMVWVTRVGWLEFGWCLEQDMIRDDLLWSVVDEKEFVCWEFSELYMEIETKNKSPPILKSNIEVPVYSNVFDRTNVFKFLYTYTFAASQAQRYQFHYDLSTYWYLNYA